MNVYFFAHNRLIRNNTLTRPNEWELSPNKDKRLHLFNSFFLCIFKTQTKNEYLTILRWNVMVRSLVIRDIDIDIIDRKCGMWINCNEPLEGVMIKMELSLLKGISRITAGWTSFRRISSRFLT